MPDKPVDISHHIDKELKKVIAELKKEMNTDPAKRYQSGINKNR